ncbi:hypothetical protein FJ979_04505 [Mesorhizobium sp. B1-1-6]|nr:hypothetical protein FJ979_04505 [Mesorhizobium sp. B1-1-6]
MRFATSLLALAASLAIAGCVSSGEAIQGPSGKVMQEAKCNGSPNVCLKQAAATCKGPYQVLDSSSNAGGLIADVIPGPVTWYRMTYQCGPSDGRMPSFPFRGPQPPVVVRTTPATTTCNRFGNSVTCNTY